MNQRVVYFNGKFVPESEAKVSIYDSSLMFGDMVFEMTRSFNHKHFLLDEHIDRLFFGIKILEIPFKYSKKNVLDFCYETTKVNQKMFSKKVVGNPKTFLKHKQNQYPHPHTTSPTPDTGKFSLNGQGAWHCKI